MLCKELSVFSKEFTTCLTTAGVRVTPQFLGVTCGYLITALGSLPWSAFWFFMFTCALFNLSTDVLGQGSSNCGILSFWHPGTEWGWELMMLTVLRRQRQIKFVSLLWISQSTGVFPKMVSSSLDPPLVPSSLEDVMCIHTQPVLGTCSLLCSDLHVTRLLSLWLSFPLVKGAVVVLNLLRI